MGKYLSPAVVVAAALGACAVPFLPSETAAPPPNPSPLFKPGGTARQTPVMKVISYSENGKLLIQPSFNVGNKSVDIQRRGTWRERTAAAENRVYINNGEKLQCFLLWSGGEGANSGEPFKELADDPPKLVADESSGVISYRKPYLDRNGGKAVFTYQLKPIGESRVELSWDTGSKETTTVNLHFPGDSEYRGKKLYVGREELAQASTDDLLKGKARAKVYSGDLGYDPENPLNAFTLELNGAEAVFSEGATKQPHADAPQVFGRYDFPGGNKGKIVIDFGEARILNKESPAPDVGGINFWKEDAILLPTFPTRNLMPNPSFEQGFRYWTWAWDGKYLGGVIDEDVYSLSDDALFGKRALRIKGAPATAQAHASSLFSFPMQLDKAASYTLSFHAKALTLPAQVEMKLSGAAQGSSLPNKDGRFAVSKDWKRYSYTFTADQFGLKLFLNANADVLIDGIQLEKGERPTDFACAPLEGNLTTSHPENDIVYGTPLDAGFTFVGKPGTKGKVSVEVSNIYRETLCAKDFAVAIGKDGTASVKLGLDDKEIGKGIFVVQAKYEVAGFEPYTDFYRFSVMAPLDNTQPTASLVGTLMFGTLTRVTRAEDVARKFKEWGFGSTSWVPPAAKDGQAPPDWQRRQSEVDNTTLAWRLMKKNGIKDVHYALWDFIVRNMDFPGRAEDMKAIRDRKISMRVFSGKPIDAATEKMVEETTCQLLKDVDPESCLSVSWGNEEESSDLPAQGRFDEYFKYQGAVARGARRANPKLRVAPTCGTAGYSALRGHDAMEGYMKAAYEAGFKYDAIAVHPYSNIDGGWFGRGDMDAESAHLIDTMKRYGLGKDVPIYYTECGNNPPINIPQWSTENGDVYRSGKPSYSWGNAEFVMAASYLRKWIICLKYWPQVQATNVWIDRPFMDLALTPMFLCKAANTFGRLLPDATFIGDIRPAGGVRGYAFRLKDGSGVAPIWFVSVPLEKGEIENPKLKVKFSQEVELVDMMENPRRAEVDSEGYTELPLTPAPLFVKARDPELLAKDLQNAELDDFTSSFSLVFEPTLDGDVALKLNNLLGRRQTGSITFGKTELQYDLPPLGEKTMVMPGPNQGAACGKMYRSRVPYSIRSGKHVINGEWSMDYFYVPRVDDVPDWSKIPAFPIANADLDGNSAPKDAADFSAVYQVAWDKDNLYLRVEAKDDKYLTFPDRWLRGAAASQLWMHDGCLEVYFDCGANGRADSRKTYDLDDYRYDFAINRNLRDGSGSVWRCLEVDHQLADGINMPTKQEAAEKVKCAFRRVEGGYVYTITFAQRYLEPIVLRRGFLAGFALYLHDHDEGHKALTTGIEPGKHCQMRPFDWPLMMLK